MEPFGDDDMIHVARPRYLIRPFLAVLHVLTRRGIARDRGDTITAVTEVLSSTGRAGTVSSRQGNDEWRVDVQATSGTAAPATPLELGA